MLTMMKVVDETTKVVIMLALVRIGGEDGVDNED